MSIIMLHPKGKVSPVQEAQMSRYFLGMCRMVNHLPELTCPAATILDENVHNVSVEGSFDDCQDIVKTLFGDPELNKTHHLGAVNSINW